MTHQQFETAYRENFSLTRRFLLSRGMGAPRADELAQAAWSKAWERRDQLRELSSVAAWVNTIALNLLRGEARKAVPQVEIEDRDEPVRSSIDSRLDAEKTLGALSDKDRRLMLLNIVAGLTSKEIAEDSGLSPVAIRVRLHRAKVELRKRFVTSGSRRHTRQISRRRCGSAR